MSREVEFGQKPFIAGTFVGVRSFRVDGLTLTGCARREPWAAGVNEATCLRDRYTLAWESFIQMPPETPHRSGTLGCTCGFYAYFDQGANPHHEPGNVLGIVEGFGSVTAGSRGFRAEKARIVALIEPARSPAAMSCPCGCGLLRGERRAAPDVHPIAARYDVPVFPSIEAAVAAHPLTPVEVPITDAPVEPFPTWALTFTVTAQQATSTLSGLMRRMGEAATQASRGMSALKSAVDNIPAETPKDRALRLRRERNTGPANLTGLDGVRHGRTMS